MLDELNVTRAGARLGLTQSAVSHSLGRLRQMLADELFIRTARGMRPTPRAIELGPLVRAGLRQLQAAVSREAFDPATSRRRFTIAAGAYSCAVLIPPLVERVSAVAPAIELAVTEYAFDALERLDTRTVDFLIAAGVTPPDRFACEPLLEEELAWVINSKSPLAGGGAPDRRALAAAPHILITPPLYGSGVSRGSPHDIIARSVRADLEAFDASAPPAGFSRRIGLTVPDAYSALAVASRSNMVAVVPRRLAILAAENGRLVVAEPLHRPAAFEIALICLRERLEDPAIGWLKAMVEDIAARM